MHKVSSVPKVWYQKIRCECILTVHGSTRLESVTENPRYFAWCHRVQSLHMHIHQGQCLAPGDRFAIVVKLELEGIDCLMIWDWKIWLLHPCACRHLLEANVRQSSNARSYHQMLLLFTILGLLTNVRNSMILLLLLRNWKCRNALVSPAHGNSGTSDWSFIW